MYHTNFTSELRQLPRTSAPGIPNTAFPSLNAGMHVRMSPVAIIAYEIHPVGLASAKWPGQLLLPGRLVDNPEREVGVHYT